MVVRLRKSHELLLGRWRHLTILLDEHARGPEVKLAVLGELCSRPLAESRGHRAGLFATQVRCSAAHVANLVAAVELIIILL